MDIRVAHSESLDRGGALFVAEELARTFDSRLYVGFNTSGVVAEDVDAIEIFDNKIIKKLSQKSSFVRDAYFSLAWQHVPELHEADMVIESGNNPGWYVPHDTQTVVRYVHSTPYAAYNRFHDTGQSLAGKLYGTFLRTLYLQTIPFPDVWVANSELVACRMEQYWGISDVEVVYPPVDVKSYTSRKRSNYFFTFSHLRSEKRIGEIIKAFDGLEEQLVIGGDGPERNRLEVMAPENVEFVGYLTEQEKRRRLGEARALVFNARSEDFGMVPVEALASGTPVIGVNEGYTTSQIKDRKNGILYKRGVEHLQAAIRDFEEDHLAWTKERIIEDAEKYDIQNFKSEISRIVSYA
jgi:glycosyltransferase involved in cell wall biosynthesis